MNISDQARKMIKDQQQEWELAKKNYAGLKSVQSRILPFDGFDVLVQFNPERIQSSAAKVDAKSIEARPCFLCQKNLPKEQRGIPVLDHYLILVNPFPIYHYPLPLRPFPCYAPEYVHAHHLTPQPTATSASGSPLPVERQSSR